MSSQGLAKSIRKRYREKVVFKKDVPTQFDNQLVDDKFTKPDDAMWCRLSIIESITTQQDICDKPIVRTIGNIIFNVFSPLGKGDKEAREFCDLIASKFRIVTSDGVVYRSPTISPSGRDGQWWQINVTVPFQYDFTHTGD